MKKRTNRPCAVIAKAVAVSTATGPGACWFRHRRKNARTAVATGVSIAVLPAGTVRKASMTEGWTTCRGAQIHLLCGNQFVDPQSSFAGVCSHQWQKIWYSIKETIRKRCVFFLLDEILILWHLKKRYVNACLIASSPHLYLLPLPSGLSLSSARTT
jgi:hypothetical protein